MLTDLLLFTLVLIWVFRGWSVSTSGFCLIASEVLADKLFLSLMVWWTHWRSIGYLFCRSVFIFLEEWSVFERRVWCNFFLWLFHWIFFLCVLPVLFVHFAFLFNEFRWSVGFSAALETLAYLLPIGLASRRELCNCRVDCCFWIGSPSVLQRKKNVLSHVEH